MNKKTNEVIDVTKDFELVFDDDVEDLQEDLTSIETLLDQEREKVKKLSEKLHSIITILKRSPEKAVIKWPNRIADVEKFEKSIEEILDHSNK